MPTIILSKVKDGLDPSMKKKAFAFLEKLSENDTAPGLHVEPLSNAVDRRVRTGRVDDNYRCVMFRIPRDGADPVYVIHGIWPHDKANSIATRVRLSMNPISGVPEIEQVMDDVAEAAQTVSSQTAPTAPAGEHETPAPGVETITVTTPAPSWAADIDAAVLHSRLGIDADLAADALAAPDEAALMEVIAGARIEWQGLALLDLAAGTSLQRVIDDFGLARTPDSTANEDEKLLAGLQTPAGRATFHWVPENDNESLRRIVESGDLGMWRLFLHPDQQAFVDRDFTGPARLSGGAGTGKTVVAVHRARRLASTDTGARILLTTYTRNLADDLAASLRRLDDGLTLPTKLGDPGVLVKGIDAVAWAVVQRAGADIADAVATVLGTPRASVLKGSSAGLWQEAIETVGSALPAELATPAFFEAEYGLVVLPNRITTATQYVRVRRPGRGVALDRAKRLAVWEVVETYRSKARAAETTDYEEKAAIAAAWLEGSGATLFDHVLVDEAQDLTPSHLRLLRALAAPGRNDLFICEDSHQRIYGHKVTLSHQGIDIRGRSRRLTLNYRTTAQNLAYALKVLDGGDYTDLEGVEEEHRYHSARTGPDPVSVHGATVTDQLRVSAELIASWLHEGAEPAAIAVLVPSKWVRQTVVTGLTEHGLDVRSVDREPVKPGKPVVMTMHRAKGLEFTHVLLFGTTVHAAGRHASDADRADAILRRRSLMYVAATRARDVLAICDG